MHCSAKHFAKLCCLIRVALNRRTRSIHVHRHISPAHCIVWNDIALRPRDKKLGATLANAGGAHLGEAVESYQRALQIRPDYIRGHVNLGIAYQNQKRDDLAALSFAKAVELGCAMGTNGRRNMGAWELLRNACGAMVAQLHKPPPELDLMAKFNKTWEAAATSGDAARTEIAALREAIVGSQGTTAGEGEA